MNFYQGKPSPHAIGPDGVKPEFIVVSNNIDVKPTVDQVIKRLVHKEGIDPKSIVILSPLNSKNSLLEEGHKIGNLSLSWESKGNQYIQCSTVHSYKGLESPIVIFVELGSAHKQTHSELLYIGMSRARNHLIVIASEEEKQNLDSLGAN
tara:strand:- start:47 stop:496 length:450 start_codon:yes stop_codon:yes gene_type:complete